MSWPVSNSYGNSRSSIFETFHTQGFDDEEFDVSAGNQTRREVIDVDDDVQFVDSPVEEEQMENIATLFMSCSPGRDTEEEEEDEDDSVPLSKVYGLQIAKPRRGGSTNTGGRKKPVRKKPKKDPNAPKKSMTAYSLFFRDTQASIKCQNQQASFGEISRIVATMWDSLEPHEKEKYTSQADKDRQVYLKALAAYEASKKSGPKKKKAKQQTAPKVISPNVSSDEDSDFIVASKSSIANKSSYRSAAKQKSPSPSISSESHSESVDTLSDSESKSSAENDKEVVPQCSRTDCQNSAVVDPRWDYDFCSVDCIVLHCRDVFTAWVASRRTTKVE